MKKRVFFLSLAFAFAAITASAYPARSVIEIWIWGGPSQLETFDPKPDAPKDYNNSLKSIPTNVPGVEISELLPKLAKQADKYSIIRTMTHPHRGHEIATYLMQTGREPGGGRVYPAIGAVIGMFKSRDYKGDLPPYVILTVPKGRFSETGFLGERYAPLVTGGNPALPRFTVDSITPPAGVSDEDNRRRFEMLDKVDRFARAGAASGAPFAAEFEGAGKEAKRIVFGDAAKVFDLSLESPETLERYGKSSFARSCLVARRLVEAGVPYITINAQGWDSHKKHFETMRQRTAEMDQAVAALLSDLAERKLLDQTIVLWTGEFGRTPKIDWEAPWNGGRNHYSECFSAMVAGGGFQGGKVVGVSDEVAGKVVERPVAPQDLLGSVYELCGIDPDGKLPNPVGIETTVLPPESPAGRLRELYTPEALAAVKAAKSGKGGAEK